MSGTSKPRYADGVEARIGDAVIGVRWPNDPARHYVHRGRVVGFIDDSVIQVRLNRKPHAVQRGAAKLWLRYLSPVPSEGMPP